MAASTLLSSTNDAILIASFYPGLPGFSFEVDHENGEIGRTDSTDSTGLTKISGANAAQFLACLGTKLRQSVEVEVGGNRARFHPLKPFYLLGLPMNIPRILRFERYLFHHLGGRF